MMMINFTFLQMSTHFKTVCALSLSFKKTTQKLLFQNLLL
jgi:hypothetical protein